MISVNYQGTSYKGRLISLIAITESFRSIDPAAITYKNVGYQLKIMDAFGAIICLTLPDLNCIEFL